MSTGDYDSIMADVQDIEGIRDEHDMEKDLVSSRPKSFQVVVDEDHPFDLDSYIEQYSGRSAIQILLHIANHCPQLAAPSYKRASELYKTETRDANGYISVIHAYNALEFAVQGRALPVDHAWIDAIETKNARDKNKLEAELRTYTSNMIKESVRMAHRDLASFHYQTGNLAEALKHYAKCREFCATIHHVLETSLQVLEVLIEQRNYSHIGTYVYKAESALESNVNSTSSSSATAAGRRGPVPPVVGVSDGGISDGAREKGQSKLDLATAISHMGQGNYEKAARSFLKIKGIKDLDDWCGKLVSASDIAVFAVLCSLATLSRSALKAAVIENDTFSAFIQQEQYVYDLLEAYQKSKFKDVLSILEHQSTRHALSPHLAPHLSALTQQIRSRALVLYFTPFQSVRLETMSAAFGINSNILEAEMVKLIKEGRVRARIDGRNKILQSPDADHSKRESAYRKILQVGRDLQATNRKLQLRMALIQADLIVRAPKSERERFLTNAANQINELYD